MTKNLNSEDEPKPEISTETTIHHRRPLHPQGEIVENLDSEENQDMHSHTTKDEAKLHSITGCITEMHMFPFFDILSREMKRNFVSVGGKGRQDKVRIAGAMEENNKPSILSLAPRHPEVNQNAPTK
jgi:hypothetical protein